MRPSPAAHFLLINQNSGSAEVRLLEAGAAPAGVTGALTAEGTAGGLRLCNTTPSLVGVAIGYKEGRLDHRGLVEHRGIDLRDADRGAAVVALLLPLCSRRRSGRALGRQGDAVHSRQEFKIPGVEDCVARGFERSGFFEVDTGEQASWMVQLTEPGETGTGGR